MGTTFQTNSFSGGMNMDLDYSLLKNNQYTYAENVRVISNADSSFAVMQSVEGFLKTNPSFKPTGEKIIHVTTVRNLAVVLTEINATTFSVYRYDFGVSEVEPNVTKIIANKQLGIAKDSSGNYSISSTCKWESSDNIKWYFADGTNPIRVINIDSAHDAYNQTVSVDALSIIPVGILPALKFNGMGSGSLSAGKYQYCYQLFNTRGSETSISALSPIIFASKGSYTSSAQSIIGSKPKEVTNKSIKLSIDLESTSFDRAKIIRIYYSDYTSLPEISIIDDIRVNGRMLIYEDRGGSVLSELTVDEFNALISYPFIPKVIEAKDDILFAANITEETWDISEDYDTRSFRANENGTVLLTSNSGQSNISFQVSDIEGVVIPKEHDCICLYNGDISQGYKYGKDDFGNNVLGGVGKNISYRFVTTNLIEDDSIIGADGKIPETFELPNTPRGIDTLRLYGISNSGTKSEIGGFPLTSSGNVIVNYANPEIEALVKSYQRDEVYRFGIVFYNKNNIPSPAHWIADIRMPRTSDSGFDYFTKGTKVTLSGGVQTGNLACVTHPLGIEFTVKNIPSDVTGFEIVRSERTLSDRSILSQGPLSVTTLYDNSANELLAVPYLTYSSDHGYESVNSKYKYSFRLGPQNSLEYFTFTSPEIATSRQNSSELISAFNTIDVIGYVTSPIKSSIFSESPLLKGMANAKMVRTDPNSTTLKDIETLSYDKVNGYIFSEADSTLLQMSCQNFYAAMLSKYYQMTNAYASATIIDAKFANNVDPTKFDYENFSWKANPTSIGSITYYNATEEPWKRSVSADSNNTYIGGPHGVCAVLRSSDLVTNFPFFTRDQVLANNHLVSSPIICNMRQSVNPYGGNSYAARQNSVYNSIGAYQKRDGNSASLFVFGGDTYIGLFDYAVTTIGYNMEELDPSNRRHKKYIGAYIPLESSINLSLRSDSVQISKTFSGGYANHFVQNDIVQIGTTYTQSEPLYGYNDGFSAQSKGRVFVSSSIHSLSNTHSDTRVLNSELKTLNELSDSWTKFKPSNYIDIDTRFGPITFMKLFNNKLLFWQTNGFGTLSVNERSLISDNNIGGLTLGTGGILERYDYFTNKNGLKENQLNNVTLSDSTVYWYDYFRNEICGFDGNMEVVSKLKGVQSYLNENKDNFKVQPKSVYDKKYNETIMLLGDKALAFNEQLAAYTSFYTIDPEWFVEFSDKLYSFKNLDLYKHNFSDSVGYYTTTDKVAKFEFLVNEGYPQTKTFDTVQYGADFSKDSNFDNITFKTKRQTSFVTKHDKIDYREDTYKFVIPRNSLELNSVEQIANKSYRDRMKGKYLLCHYEYDSSKGNSFKVPYISTGYRQSLI